MSSTSINVILLNSLLWQASVHAYIKIYSTDLKKFVVWDIPLVPPESN